MPTDPLKAISNVLEEAENTTKSGMFLVKTANQTVEDVRRDDLHRGEFPRGGVPVLYLY